MRNNKRKAQEKAPLACSFCGKTAAAKSVVSQAFGSGASLVVIEKVPTVSCSSCGEVYFDGETLKELDRILLNRKPLTRTGSVWVVEFA